MYLCQQEKQILKTLYANCTNYAFRKYLPRSSLLCHLSYRILAVELQWIQSSWRILRIFKIRKSSLLFYDNVELHIRSVLNPFIELSWFVGCVMQRLKLPVLYCSMHKKIWSYDLLGHEGHMNGFSIQVSRHLGDIMTRMTTVHKPESGRHRCSKWNTVVDKSKGSWARNIFPLCSRCST